MLAIIFFLEIFCHSLIYRIDLDITEKVMKKEIKTGEPVNILLVEDDPGHAELIKRTLKEHRIANHMYHLSDGEAALDYLFRQNEYSNPKKSPLPHLILLDLRLPKVDGLEILKQIKKKKELRQIPVVVLTTSEAEKDVARAYENYVNSYLVKPVDFEKLSNLIELMGFYWLGWNKNPWE